MDIDKLLASLDAKGRRKLFKRLLAEESSAQQPLSVEQRLVRLEQVVFDAKRAPSGEPQRKPGSASGFDFPWGMMSRMMGGVAQPARQMSNDRGTVHTAQTARVFNALADTTRLNIVKLLSQGEKNVEQLVQALGIAQSTTSHHLKVLKEANLIKGEKRGRSVFYTLTQPLTVDERKEL